MKKKAKPKENPLLKILSAMIKMNPQELTEFEAMLKSIQASRRKARLKQHKRKGNSK